MTFAVAAEAYDRFMGRYSAPLAPRFADFAGIRADATVVDVGCGPGALTAELVRRVGPQSVAAVAPSAPLVGAGLLGKSLYRLMTVELNFAPERVAMMHLVLPRSVAASPEQSIAAVRDLLARVSTMPGVESAGITSVPPVMPCA